MNTKIPKPAANELFNPMKTPANSLLLMALLCASLMYAQDMTQYYGKSIMPISPSFPRMEAAPRSSTSENKPLDLKDYLLRWLRPTELFDELYPKPMPFPELMLNTNTAAFLSSGYSPQSNQVQSLSESAQEAWVRHYASYLKQAAHDIAAAIAVEGSGNIYVTGTSYATVTNFDYATVKYNASGVKQWIARYNGSGNLSDSATAIVVDNAGNIYVTGKSSGPGSSFDYATVKYNSSGVEQWVARYNGLGNRDDIATAIAVDSADDIYVTGRSIGLDNLFDYVTIKYSPWGAEQWAAHYNGLGNSDNQTTVLVLDHSGNVYVTGWSQSENKSYDYVTIKYNSSGVEQWVAKYDGPLHGNDFANALAVDVSGNVYVTGASAGLSYSGDYATVKYNSTGIEQWVARHNGPADMADNAQDIAVDNTGNVYVTGFSTTLFSVTPYHSDIDYLTIKYTPLGIEQWVARYAGPVAQGGDYATTLAVDRHGNVYVTGLSEKSPSSYEYATAQYDSSGVQQWVVRYNAHVEFGYFNTFAMDDFDNIYVTGGARFGLASSDYVTVKYNSSGSLEWTGIYNGPGYSDDIITAVAVDASGNVYVTGGSESIGVASTVKYSSAGVQEWVAQYNVVEKSFNWASDIAVDALENVYVTGYSNSSGTDNYVTIKYNSSGIQEWVVQYDGSANAIDRAIAILVDASGNVYVTGSSVGVGTSFDYVTIKYNSSGVEQWEARYNGVGNAADMAIALATDESGNIYVTGRSKNAVADNSYDYTTLKYNSAGLEQWVARYDGPGNSYDQATGLAVDAPGNVYVTGSSAGQGTSEDYATIKYNSSGVEQWVSRYNGPANSDDYPTALAVDASGNVCVTGNSLDPNSSIEFATIKYNASGIEQWAIRYGGHSGEAFGFVNALALDNTGNIYVAGSAYFSRGYDCLTIKYSPFGVQQWIARYNGPENAYDYATAMVVDGSANVYVAGYSHDQQFGFWNIFTTIKYVQDLVSVKDRMDRTPGAYRLEQNYPNPFNPSTTIRYAIAKPGHVALNVFNLQGQEIATLVNENKLAGEYEIQWNPTDVPSGVYVYRLQAGEFMETKKLILMK